MTDFEEYIRQGEPNKREKAYAWRTAIGLQAVDGLTTSDYLKETARRHIEGEIDIDEAQRRIKSYYQSKTNHEPDDDEKQEGIDYSPVYLERFFRNLLLGEQWELRSRYLHIHPTEEWQEQPNHTPTSAGQVQDKYKGKHEMCLKQIVRMLCVWYV